MVDGMKDTRYNVHMVVVCPVAELLYGRKTSRARGGITVSEVRIRENESLESALKRFKRQCARTGVLAEARKREHYEKPSVKRKKKAEAARKRKY